MTLNLSLSLSLPRPLENISMSLTYRRCPFGACPTRSTRIAAIHNYIPLYLSIYLSIPILHITQELSIVFTLGSAPWLGSMHDNAQFLSYVQYRNR